MPTSPDINDLLVDEALSFKARAQVSAEMDALPSDAIRPLNRKPDAVITTVRGAVPKILKQRPSMVEAFRTFDLTPIDQLDTLALAFQNTQAQHLAATRPRDAVKPLAAEGRALCDKFRADAAALCANGLLNPSSFASCRGLPGYKNTSTELGVYVAVFRAALPLIQGKCSIDVDVLDRAERISGALLRCVGMREKSPAVIRAATDARDRAFTLLTRAYDQARRAVQFIRFDEGDADEIAPSLYGGRHRQRKSKKASGAPVPAPEPPTAPAAEVYGPPGTPNSNPFTS